MAPVSINRRYIRRRASGELNKIACNPARRCNSRGLNYRLTSMFIVTVIIKSAQRTCAIGDGFREKMYA